MPKKINSLKDIVWAVSILVALVALVVALIYGALGHWYGDKSRPVMDIGHKAVSGGAVKTGAGLGTAADGTLHTLGQTGDAGQSYLDSLTFVVDSSYVGLRGSPLTQAPVWASQDGTLSMSAYDSWRVIYSDDSSVTIPNAAMIAKPGLLVLAIGNDGAAGLSQEQFTALYKDLIAGILRNSPQTRIICGSLCSVTAAYVGEDGMTAEKAGQIDGWIRQICIDTGAVWADWSDVICDGGYLRPEFAESDGRTLNSMGVSTLCSWLRTHAAAD